MMPLLPEKYVAPSSIQGSTERAKNEAQIDVRGTVGPRPAGEGANLGRPPGWRSSTWACQPPEPECLVLDIHGQGTPAARSTCQQMVFDQPEDQGVPGICDAVLAGPPTRTRANMMSGKASSSRPENAECRGMRHKASETRR
ncbi:hypothetical protein Purlil1_5688 [Purpureocillium lilacinum]|uniref:Uncharacterized protein n=1 Tax=Purpureocillium lilacinum TaxID=33203 RepID=A0ABR0C189_PURLI|nr:hypothetical protein Purlil1_5688 [Purpureocillium lilacinum]